MYFLTYAAGFTSAVIFLFICMLANRRIRQRKKKRNIRKVKIDTYVKAATSVVIAHGLTMVTMSYVLAWFEKDTVVDVSMTLITEIVAPLCLYIGTNCIMNIFEKNKLSFSEPIQMQKVREVWDKVHEDMEDETGGNAVG